MHVQMYWRPDTKSKVCPKNTPSLARLKNTVVEIVQEEYFLNLFVQPYKNIVAVVMVVGYI